METKKSYKKPEYEEVEMISEVALLAGSGSSGSGES